MHSPITEVLQIDRLDPEPKGGLEMGIVVQAALDGTPETLARIEQKVRYYLQRVLDPGFQQEYGIERVDRVSIYLESRFSIDTKVVDLLAALAQETQALLGLKLTRPQGSPEPVALDAAAALELQLVTSRAVVLP